MPPGTTLSCYISPHAPYGAVWRLMSGRYTSRHTAPDGCFDNVKIFHMGFYPKEEHICSVVNNSILEQESPVLKLHRAVLLGTVQ
uniref:Uncharacterized protein n=1 Tax=Romanomermis culicivorax TaxID=13658 RepID=A0A915KU01_ROMCU